MIGFEADLDAAFGLTEQCFKTSCISYGRESVSLPVDESISYPAVRRDGMPIMQ